MKTWLNDILVDKDKSYPDSFNKNNYSKIKIDSRLVKNEDIFIAFQGENINSHIFLKDIYEKVSLFFYDKKGISLLDDDQIKCIDFSKGVEVTDSSKVLSLICRGVCRDFIHKDRVKICALTGSVGKTTTRAMVVNMLKHLNPLTPEGNFNNEIGIPLTILKYKSGFHKCVILEFGARHVDDIDYLCGICEPDISSCINVYSSHLQEFKTVENIYKAKSQIFNHSDYISTLGDDPILLKLASVTKKNLLLFGYTDKNNIKILKNELNKKNLSSKIYVKINSKKEIFELPSYHFSYGIDLVSALSIAIRIEPDINILKENMKEFKPASKRFEIIKKNSYTIVNDCYNASFESMTVSIITFNSLFGSSNVLILGDMLELGEKSLKLHLKLEGVIESIAPSYVICVGTIMKNLYDSLTKNTKIPSLHYDSVDLIDYTKLKEIIKDKAVLIKASNSMRFSDIVSYLNR